MVMMDDEVRRRYGNISWTVEWGVSTEFGYPVVTTLCASVIAALLRH